MLPMQISGGEARGGATGVVTTVTKARAEAVQLRALHPTTVYVVFTAGNWVTPFESVPFQI